ncbi:glycosyl hydrolase [Cytophagia bacterium]|nr:glycosyl hydrolase [Cytophagia bacterium]
MKKLTTLLPSLILLLIFNTNSSNSQEISTEQLYESLEWKFAGPYRGGRSTAVSGVISKPYTFYMGTTGGGVWKTTDAGNNWKNISDGQITVGSIGAISVSESDENVIYVGTGSADPRGNISIGNGIYKSVDSGENWEFIGLPKAGLIGKIEIHPRNSDIVYVAALGNIFGPNAERGVYKTIDGGKNWEKVYFISNKTGARDVEINPDNENEILASFWTVQRKPWTLVDGSDEGGVFMSKDAGKSWKKLTEGLPKGLTGKIQVEYSPANSSRLWAMIQAQKEEEGGLYRSDDGGKTWSRINRDHKLRQRGWYYSHINADPVNENIIYASNTGFYKSVDGGKTFDERLYTQHGDNHGVWINPNDNKIMINCNDGGANVSLNGGETWSTQLNQPTPEFYRLTVDNQFPFRMYAGQQDNSTISVPSRGLPALTPFQNWFNAGGTECSDIAVHPTNPNIIYSTGYSGEFTYKNLTTGEEYQRTPYVHLTEGTRQDDLKYRFQWNYPVFVSKYNPDNVYVGSNVVHVTSDKAVNWDIISPDLTRQLLKEDEEKADIPGGPIQNDATGVEVYSSIFALEESPHNEGEIWVGSDDGLIHITRDGGKSWVNITPEKIIPYQGTINKIELSSHEPGRAIVAVYNYRNNDFKPYIIVTNDYGENWKIITKNNGIPSDHFVRAVAEDPARKGLLYAGTEFGAYVSFNNGKSWNSLQMNLPHVPITDMEVTQNDLAISTQGRGFWILDKINVLQDIHLIDDKPLLFTPEPALRTNLGGGRRSGGIRFENDISFYLPRDYNVDEIELFIKDPSGNIVVNFQERTSYLFDVDYDEEKVYAGTHTIYWDLEHEEPKIQKDFISMYYSANRGNGPLAIPGTYTIELNVQGEIYSKPLEVRMDPRWKISAQDLEMQFNVSSEVVGLINESQEKLSEMRGIVSQITKFISLTEGKDYHKEVKDLGNSIIESIKNVENNLYQDKIETSQDEINYPRKWTNHITHLYDRLTTDDQAPNDGMLDRVQELKSDYERYINPYQEIVGVDVPNFTKFLREKGAMGIILD